MNPCQSNEARLPFSTVVGLCGPLGLGSVHGRCDHCHVCGISPMSQEPARTGCVLPRTYRKRVEKVLTSVLAEFCIDGEQLWKGSRSPTRCWARWIAWHYLLKAGMTHKEVASVCGYAHSSISFGVQRLKLTREEVPALNEMFNAVGAELIDLF